MNFVAVLKEPFSGILFLLSAMTLWYAASVVFYELNYFQHLASDQTHSGWLVLAKLVFEAVYFVEVVLTALPGAMRLALSGLLGVTSSLALAMLMWAVWHGTSTSPMVYLIAVVGTYFSLCSLGALFNRLDTYYALLIHTRGDKPTAKPATAKA